MKTHIGILIFTLWLACGMAAAQNPDQNLAAIHKVGKDCIELRWAPLNYDAWQLGLSGGYIVERSTILRKGKLVDPVERKVLTASPVKVAPEREWERYEDDRYAMVAGECIFGQPESDDTDFLPMMAYKRHQDKERRLGFALYSADMSVNAARLQGLYFKDAEARADEKYLYKIRFATMDSLICDTASTFAGLAEYQPLYAPEHPYVSCQKNKISVWWQTMGQKFNSYYVEKSTDGGRTFQRLGDAPVAVPAQGDGNRVYYSDTLVSMGSTYHYRIVGIDSFGEESPASEPVSSKLVAPLEREPDFTSVAVEDNSRVVMKWYYDPDADVSGFKIYRAKGTKARKTIIYNGRDPQARTFTDESPRADNYYYLSVYNETGEIINPFPFYAQLIDSIPPDAPLQAPAGYCDSLGLVHLSWSPHPDEDVAGYRLLSSNSPSQDFMMCARDMIVDTFYVDTINLNNLTRHVYYQLLAVDGRDNQSAPSPVAAVLRYDTIAPAPPAIAGFEWKKGKVEVEIKQSPSKDVASYTIFRKTSDTDIYDTLATMAASDIRYIDETAVEGTRYQYGVQAVDEFGLRSAMVRRSFETPAGKEPAVQLRKKLSGSELTLSWEASGPKTPAYAVVYRKVNDKSLRTLSQVWDGNSFVDKDLTLGNTYIYRVRIVYGDGSESPLSNEIKIQF